MSEINVLGECVGLEFIVAFPGGNMNIINDDLNIFPHMV